MPQVTKTLNGAINGISVTIDGSSVYANVMWTDPSAPAMKIPGAPANAPTPPARPLGVSPVQIVGGKVKVGQNVIGDAPADIATAAAALASKVKTLVEGLISSGKITL
jgi:hypothetical protein